MNDRMRQACLLVVDDQEANVVLLERLLATDGFTNVVATTNSSEALSLCERHDPDLVLLDLQMPEPDGLEVMARLQSWVADTGRLPVPVVVLTADNTRESKREALSRGASDFLTKPFDTSETLLRIKNLLTTRLLQCELRTQNSTLERRVHDRTHELEAARFEVAERLALAAEYRDDDTGEHTRRVASLATALAHAQGLPPASVEQIRRAAPLHDIGKIAVPDSILLKAGRLTPEEFEAMKAHTTVGGRILAHSHSELLRMSEEIALTHHERWDGGGYPNALAGDAIPLAGRIVAIADVFDALTHERPYKEAWSVPASLEEIERLAGTQFDPMLVNSFVSLDLAAAVSESMAPPRQDTSPHHAQQQRALEVFRA